MNITFLPNIWGIWQCQISRLVGYNALQDDVITGSLVSRFLYYSVVFLCAEEENRVSNNVNGIVE